MENFDTQNEKKRSLIEWYKDNFYLNDDQFFPLLNQNFFCTRILLVVIFLWAFFSLFGAILLNFHNLTQIYSRIFYYCGFIILTASLLIFSANIKRTKKISVIILPIYVLFFCSELLGLYNFFMLNKVFNGFVVYVISNLCVISLFDLSPLLFSVTSIVPFSLMVFGLYNTYGLSGTADSCLLYVVLVVLAFYKRYLQKAKTILNSRQKENLSAKTFGNFTLLYKNSTLKFQRRKSLELLAYLIYKNGTGANSQELVSVLFGENATSAVYGNSLRNLIIDIKHTLKENQIENFFLSEYNNFRINPLVISCDYYDFLKDPSSARGKFNGEFMNQFSWAEEAIGFIEKKI